MKRRFTDPPRIIGSRVRGELHASLNQPCCDALFLPRQCQGLQGFVICDGAGGSAAVAAKAWDGSRAAWRALLAVRRALNRSPLHVPAAIQLQTLFLGAFLRSRRRQMAGNHTVLACLWDRRRVLVAQVGDSSLLVRKQGVWQLPVLPHKGGFANETAFLRSDTSASAISLWWTPSSMVEAVIGFSDGLEAAFLAPQPGHPERLEPNRALADLVLEHHHKHLGSPSYANQLEASLRDPAIQALSDDDRTLVIAAAR